MAAVEAALEPLEPAERGRVLRWAGERFNTPFDKRDNKGAGKVKSKDDNGSADAITEGIGEFYAEASPNTESERTLVVAYWVQERQDSGDFDSQAVNTELKHLGHGVSNITRAIDVLKKHKPQFVIQIQKSGKAKQARKRYKVTAAGKDEVKRILRREPEA